MFKNLSSLGFSTSSTLFLTLSLLHSNCYKAFVFNIASFSSALAQIFSLGKDFHIGNTFYNTFDTFGRFVASLWLKNEREERLSSDRSDHVTGLCHVQEPFFTWVFNKFNSVLSSPTPSFQLYSKGICIQYASFSSTLAQIFSLEFDALIEV